MIHENELQQELLNLLRKLKAYAIEEKVSQILEQDIRLLKTEATIPSDYAGYLQVCYYLMILISSNPSLMIDQNKINLEEFQSKLHLKKLISSNDASKTTSHKGK